ncbi:MAG TPA: hypothetical protein VK810_02435 [Dongiaceae bacterium]|jgi:hypothetical protein|nr:hypothetical protein [Dongiaceae bacterium]
MSKRPASSFKGNLVLVVAVLFLITIELFNNWTRKLIWGQTGTQAFIVVPIIAIIILIIARFLLKKKGRK